MDSAVAAWILREQGHEVSGITFTTFKDNEYRSCGGRGSANLAKKICESLGMPHYTIGLSTLFDREIVRDFVESYRAGLTPNPCVLCNRLVKFGALADYAFSLGAELFATGHYIRIIRENGRVMLRKGIDETKDQAYFLGMTRPEQLERIVFPLGELRKTEVRTIAEKNNLPIPPKLRESQDVCFVPGDYREYLAASGVAESPGDFVLDGKVVGRHRGIAFYSFGQRRGLNVAVGHRLFVRGYDAKNNRILLGEIPVTSKFQTSAPNVFDERFAKDEFEFDVQARYQSKIVKGRVEKSSGELVIELSEPLEIVAPGQIAVFYRKDVIAAAAKIESVELL